jgi:hypothetical protein
MEKLPLSRALMISLLGIVALAAEFILYIIVMFTVALGSVDEGLSSTDSVDSIKVVVFVFMALILITIAVIILAPIISLMQIVIEKVKQKEEERK